MSDEESRAELAGSQEAPGRWSSAQVRRRREGPEEEQTPGAADCLRLQDRVEHLLRLSDRQGPGILWFILGQYVIPR